MADHELPTPPSRAALAATDDELLAMRSWSSHGPTFDSDLVEFGRACYDLGRQHGAAQPPRHHRHYGGTMIVPTANYPTSRDYRQLWKLAHTAAVVCIVDMDHGKPDTCRDIARTVHSPEWSPELVQVGSRGIGHVWAESLEAFIAGCEQCNLEWLVPPAATLLQQLSAPDPAVVPIPVSERLPVEGDCDAEGRCWLLTFEDDFPQWRLHSIEGYQPGKRMIWIPVDKAPGIMVDAFYTSVWLPAHAIPLPQAEEVEG